MSAMDGAAATVRPDGRSGGGPPAAVAPLSPGGMVVRGAPPLLLPGEHFAAALVFWLAGAAGLVWVAPDLARGAFPLPRVVAVAHLFTLGWITTTILGALYQFLPVALGTPIRSERVAHAGFALYVPGLALFVPALALGAQGPMLLGAALFGTGLLLFAGNLAATLRRATERTLTWWALAAACGFLVSTVALGVSLTANLRWGFLGVERFTAVGVHLHVAVAGWVMLVVFGVAHRLLPMFLLAHRAPEWPAKLAVGLVSAGVGLLLVAHHYLVPLVRWTVAALIAGGVVAFLAQAALFFRHRRKPRLDPGLRLAAIGLGFLGVALALAPFHVAYGLGAPKLATAYVLALVLGGPSLFVAGHYYKIVPFLVWFHRFGPWVGKRPVPTVAELYHPGLAGLAAVLLGTGTAALTAAALAGAVWLARPAALAFAGGAAILFLQMLALATRRPE
jgi:hypothetical protein